MGIRNLIVLTDNRPGVRGRIKTALLMAKKYDAHLTGVYIRGERHLPTHAIELLPTVDRDAILNNLEQRSEELAEEAHRVFVDAAAEVGWEEKTHWHVVRGAPDAVAGAVGRYADLTIAGQRGDLDKFVTGVDPDQVVFDSGRPMIIVPDDFTPHGELGEHAVVGWDGGREAARALADAMLILETKSKVSIVTIGAIPNREKQIGLDIVEHLRRHDIVTEPITIERKKSDPGLDLLRYAERVGAGLLVMGAYSKSRVREQILGGATRSVLEKMTIPVFMSH